MKIEMSYFRKIFGFLIFIALFISWYNWVYTANIDNSKEQAYLIENYLVRHKDNIVDYASKYKFLNDDEVQKNLDKINQIIMGLREFQMNSWQINMSYHLTQIKKINDDVRVLIVNKKREHDKNVILIAKEYENNWKKIAEKLDKIYYIMYDKNKFEKKELSEKNKIIKETLNKLRVHSVELKYFSLKTFDTEDDIKNSFWIIINNIKNELIALKKNM